MKKVPNRSIYLFANPYSISGETVYDSKPVGERYYLKVLIHQHGDGKEGLNCIKVKCSIWHYRKCWQTTESVYIPSFLSMAMLSSLLTGLSENGEKGEVILNLIS